MRPMRLSKREVTDPTRIRQILDEAQVLHIGAQDAEGIFVVPVNFGYRWDGALPRLYLHSAREGRKADALRACEAAGLAVAVELECDRGTIEGNYSCAFSRSYASIMGSGTAHEVTDEDEREDALRLIMEHCAPGAEVSFTPAGLERVAVFRIDVVQMSAKERNPKG